MLLWFWARTASAGLLSASGVAVLDTALAVRASFSSNERIVFQQKVFNGVASANRIQFKFVVTGPTGAQVFEHVGNAVPGSSGSSASQISGVPISQFYAGPGSYALKAQAGLDGQTVEQQASFVVTSPNIILIYPPNGMQGIAEKPLTFRWSSSGATQYRVIVGDSPSFYNSLFSQQTSGGETFLSYPDNPPDLRLRLAAGQVYYWKVEGLDAGGAVVAVSAMPYNFTVAAAPLTKDLAVTRLAVNPAATALDGSLSFVITVENQGGTTESGVPLKFSVGGLPAAGTPVAMSMLAPGEPRDYSVLEALPVDQNQSLAIACVEFSDDNIANNCKTLLVARPAAGAGGDNKPIFGKTPDLSADQLCQAIWQLIQNSPSAGDMTGYDASCEDGASVEDLQAILDGLKGDLVRISFSGPPLAPPVQPPQPPAWIYSESAPPPAVVLSPDEDDKAREWSGLSQPIFKETQGFVLKTPRAWRRIWRQLSAEDPPEIDFQKSMVAAVVAGRGARADRIEMEDAAPSLNEFLVRYRLVVNRRMLEIEGPQRAAARTSVPYLLRVLPLSPLPVRFEKTKEMP